MQGPANLVVGGNVFAQLSSMYKEDPQGKTYNSAQKQKDELEINQDLDPEFVKIITMIQKKSEITKLKGL